MTETNPPKKRKGNWLSVKQLAGTLGVSSQAIRSSYLPELSTEDVRQGARGVATMVYAPAAVALYAKRRVRAALQQAATEEIESGPPSAELEKLRRVKRRREELSYARDVAEVESRGAVWSEVGEAMRHVRRFAEEQIKEHGNGTAEAWAEVVSEVDAVADRFAPPKARSRTLQIEIETGETLEIPLSMAGVKHE